MQKTQDQITRVSYIFNVISEFERLFYDEFQKTSIKKCGMCHNGLKSKYDMSDYCDNCGGTGYVGIEKMLGEYVCRRCNGGGCFICKNKGVVDWITHCNGKDLVEKR